MEKRNSFIQSFPMLSSLWGACMEFCLHSPPFGSTFHLLQSLLHFSHLPFSNKYPSSSWALALAYSLSHTHTHTHTNKLSQWCDEDTHTRNHLLSASTHTISPFTLPRLTQISGVSRVTLAWVGPRPIVKLQQDAGRVGLAGVHTHAYT